MKAIGIDPGLANTGFAIVDALSSGVRACTWGTIRTKMDCPITQRLALIYGRIRELISLWSPQLLIMEDVFVGYSSPKSAIQLGEVKGVIYLAAHVAQIEVMDIRPAEVKNALTGNGGAGKQQVAVCVKRILGLQEQARPHHASDALALALTGLFRTGYLRR